MQLTLSPSVRSNSKCQELRPAGEGMCPAQEVAAFQRLLMVSRQKWETVFTDDFFQENTKNSILCKSC